MLDDVITARVCLDLLGEACDAKIGEMDAVAPQLRRQAFLPAQAGAGPTARFVMIGDRPQADAAGARRARQRRHLGSPQPAHRPPDLDTAARILLAPVPVRNGRHPPLHEIPPLRTNASGALPIRCVARVLNAEVGSVPAHGAPEPPCTTPRRRPRRPTASAPASTHLRPAHRRRQRRRNLRGRHPHGKRNTTPRAGQDHGCSVPRVPYPSGLPTRGDRNPPRASAVRPAASSDDKAAADAAGRTGAEEQRPSPAKESRPWATDSSRAPDVLRSSWA